MALGYLLDSTKFIAPKDITSFVIPEVKAKPSGIIRYGGTPDLAWKNTDADECEQYSLAKLPWAWYFERGGGSALTNRATGRQHAEATLNDADHCHYNIRACHVVAQDTDFSGINWQSPVAAYFSGWHDVFDLNKVIVSAYGGYYVMKFLFDEGLIKLGVQTPGWSDRKIESRCAAFQHVGYVYPGNIQSDWLSVNNADWGQNLLEDAMWDDDKIDVVVRAANQVLAGIGEGQLSFSATIKSVKQVVDSLVNIVRQGDSALGQSMTNSQTAILAAVATLPTHTFSEDEKQQLANEIAAAVSSKNISIDPNAILDALHTRLES